MEAVEGPPLENIATEGVKLSDDSCEASAETVISTQSDVCHKSNGIPDVKNSEQDQPSVDDESFPEQADPSGIVIEEKDSVEMENVVIENETRVTKVGLNRKRSTTISNEVTKDVALNKTDQQDNLHLKMENNDEVNSSFEVEIDGVVETVSENVRFETEILVETNVDDQSRYQIIYSDPDEPDNSQNILGELGQSIELSDMLRSSDVSENMQNNNCEVTQEVFNKEELLDILEGNDVDDSRKVISDNNFADDCKKLETQLALQQLSRLKQAKKSRLTPKKLDKKSSRKSESPKEESVKKKSSTRKEDNNSQTKSAQKEDNATKGNATQKENHSKANNLQNDDNTAKTNITQKEDNILIKNSITSKTNSTQKDSGNLLIKSDAEPKEESIVNALVKDWEDDEPPEGAESKQVVEESEDLVEEPEEILKSQDTTANESNISNVEVSISDVPTPNLKSETEPRPQRRVIKKKVIFDPDNPDTFTKSKVTIKKDQSDKDQKDQPTPKKIKTDPTSPRPKSKSPIQSKLQWKKPQPKAIKPGKRLTEIDRLLMDEGAVNMICQLTPEAPKGHKNMKSKAEFIKKIQSSTPEGKEMKFRERKKELKFEEGDAKRIGSGKERLSLSSSVKSPTVSEDFEAHSADDSIIYRRHSSSSYSSPCMSPRRLSDGEIISQNVLALSQAVASEGQPQARTEDGVLTGSDVFMSENTGTIATGVINKKDVMSIKEKLNSKLSQALNKRKRDSIKAEKPSKIKKVSKPIEPEKPAPMEDYKYLKLIYDQKLAEICIIDLSRSVYDVEVMNEFKTVLETVNSKKDVSVTLLTAESGTLCSGLDLKALLDQEKGAIYAQELAESAKSLLCTLEAHTKLVCIGVENGCHGLGLSLVALSDITVASEKASFGLSANKDAPLQPGAAALIARGLPQSMVNEIIVFDRPVSATEALRGGLVSRTVWPERFLEQVRAIAKDIAAQPTENVMLKKQLLRLKRGGSESFLASLETERDLFVKYWTSAEGLELVRVSLDPVKE